MTLKVFCPFFLFFSVIFSLSAQVGERGNHEYVIRGEVFVEFEPIYAGHVDKEYPLDVTKAGTRALEEAALFFSAMIYGWSFYYDVGERARRIDEKLELNLLGEIKFGSPGLRVTETEIRDRCLWVWADYQLNDSEQRRLQVWRSGTVRNAQATGYAPSYLEEDPGWLGLRKIAIEDAARSAIRAMLRGSERNRPKEVTGSISLAAFPRIYVDSGRLSAAARFRVQITEIIPFAAY